MIAYTWAKIVQNSNVSKMGSFTIHISRGIMYRQDAKITNDCILGLEVL